MDKANPAVTRLPAPRPKTHDKWIWAGVFVAVISVLGMTLYHLTNGIESENKPAAIKSESRQDAAGRAARSSAPLPATWVAEDGRTMVLVPLSENLPAFYTDKSPVTFHHFVEFLNAVIDRVRVDNGVVKHQEEIWAYLGDGSAPFEQILYEHGRFHLRDTAWAPRPVVRITWWGAEAYAHFYKKRLPTAQEWRSLTTILANDNKMSVDNNAPSPPAGQGMHMMPPSDSDKATTGVTTSDGRIPLVREWLAGEPSGSGATANNKEEVIISRVAKWPIDKEQDGLQRRYPWEGFSDVGFRTVVDAGMVRSDS